MGIAPVKPQILPFLPCKHSHKFFYLIARGSPSAMVQHATEMPFPRISSLPSSVTGFIFLLFSPKGMLTHSRENIWRLIVAWEQSEGKMGRGSPQLEGLKILAIKKKKKPKKPKPKLPGFMDIQQLLLLLLAGWILPKNKASNVVFPPAEKARIPFHALQLGTTSSPHSQRGWQRVRGSLPGKDQIQWDAGGWRKT